MKSVTMATKREIPDYTVFFSVLGHKKFIHKILAKSESERFQPLFKFFWCSQRIALKCLQHLHLLALHLEILGYIPYLLNGSVYLRRIGDFRGDSLILRLLLKTQLLVIP